jgi:hypothetical protein
MIIKGMNLPMSGLMGQSRDKCLECPYKRAILEIQRALSIFGLSEFKEEKELPRE